MKYTFEELFKYYSLSMDVTKYSSFEEYREAFRKYYKISSKTEVEFDNALNPISK